ncbi:hypothetical protein PHYNN_46 [Pantoea phage Phynn]|nr:hypothetical protein PHYNN_46 [Pantoea phage Phynn]
MSFNKQQCSYLNTLFEALVAEDIEYRLVSPIGKDGVKLFWMSNPVDDVVSRIVRKATELKSTVLIAGVSVHGMSEDKCAYLVGFDVDAPSETVVE